MQPWLSERDLAELRALRAANMTETGTIRRKPSGPQTGDPRQWPLHHDEIGLLTTSRRLSQDRDGMLSELDTPLWVTPIGSQTLPGDLLTVQARWFVVGAQRAQTVQTACEWPLTEMRF